MAKFNVTSIRKDVKELEKRDIVISSDSDVGYASNGNRFSSHIHSRENAIKYKKEVGGLKSNFLFCPNDWTNCGWNIKVVEKDNPKDSYLSFNPMRTHHHGRISDALEAFKNPTPFIQNIVQNELPYWSGDPVYAEHVKGYLEMRVYKDRKINYVLEIAWGPNKRVFLCLTKETSELFKDWYCRRTILPCEDWSIDVYLKMLEDSKQCTNGVNGRAWVAAYTDADVKKNAFLDTTKSRFIERTIGVWGGDLDKYLLGLTSDRYTLCVFTPKTRKMIEDFFNYNSEANKKLRDAYNSRHLKTEDGYKSRTIAEGINSLSFLESYLLTRVPTAKKVVDDATSKNIEEIWEDFLEALSNNGTSVWSGRDRLIWHRQGRYIVAVYYTNELYKGGRYYYRRYNSDTTAACFVYDTVQKVRKFATVSKATNSIEELIPSLKNQIFNKMKVSLKQYYDYDTHRYSNRSETEVVYLDNVSTLEMFAGTNAEWIIQNKQLLGDTFMILCAIPAGDYGTRIASVPANALGDPEGCALNALYIMILATTGDTMLEQLLKSKLFKLYFLGLYGIASSGNEGSKAFKPWGKNVDPTQQCSDYVYFRYKKGSNLKKMLGLDMNKLKGINDQIETTFEFEQSESGYINYEGDYKNVTRLSVLPAALGMQMEEIARIDPASWQKLLSMVSHDSFSSYYSRHSADTPLTMVANNFQLREYVKRFNKNIKKILNFYESFKLSDLQYLSDYLDMRAQMKNLQERMPAETEKFFDEERYPLEVKKAKRFIPYIPGMTDPSVRWGNNIIDTEELFERYTRARFAFVGNPANTLQYIRKEDRLIGVAISMTPSQNMNFLHDEMARWMALYEDESKARAFQEAITRVSGFEFENPDFDLSIIAPKQSRDLNLEGKILSHCVASYVDPVIKGTENIMFIRRTDNIECPYFTMDLVPVRGVSNKFEIRQIHCYRNGDPTPEDIKNAYEESGLEVYDTPKDILGFVRSWIAWMKDKKKIQVINCVEHYGALCALCQ